MLAGRKPVWTAQGATDVEMSTTTEKRAVTADTDLRLCRYFGLSDGWWLRGQASYDTAIAREALSETLSQIPRCALMAA